MAQAALNMMKKENKNTVDNMVDENNNAIEESTNSHHLLRQNAIQRTTTLLPKFQCLSKKDLFPSSFTQWMQNENNIYISSNLAKYTQNKDAVTEWSCSWIEREMFYGNISRDEYFAEYEHFFREHKWDDLDKLFNKTLGCWCHNKHQCHFKVIYQLCKEKLLERRMRQIE